MPSQWFRRAFLIASVVLALPTFAAAQEKLSVTVAQGGEGLGWLPAYIARANKYFDDENLAVRFVITPGGSEAAAAVVSGSADFADAAHHAFRGQLRGYDFVLVANAMDQYAVMLVVSNKAIAKAGLKKGDPMSKVIPAMKGLRIGISSPGSSTDMIIRTFFKQYGLNPDRDATLTPFGTGGPMQAAMETDQIDAFVFSSPFPEIVEAHGEGQILINLALGDFKQLSGYPYTGYFTSRKVITEKPKAVQAFVDAIYKAELFIHTYPEETIKIAQTTFSDLDPGVLRLAVLNTIPAIPRDPITSKVEIETALNWNAYKPEDRAKLTFDKVVDNSFAFKAIDTIGAVPKP
jgi:NitT/TauT family transport system substrate-binding protein